MSIFSGCRIRRGCRILPERPHPKRREMLRNVVRFAWLPVRVHVMQRDYVNGRYYRFQDLGCQYVWLRWYYWQACGAFCLPHDEHYIIVDFFD